MVKNIYNFLDHQPQMAEDSYIHPAAQIIGQVIIGKDSSIWPGCVLRGDVSQIIIGQNTNIQDLSMLHVTHYRENVHLAQALIIGDNITVGHSCILHACTLQNNSFIGMGSIILDNAIIEEWAMVGAGSLVPQGKTLKSGYLYFGSPVKEIRKLTPEELENITYSANHYSTLAKQHKKSS